MKPLLAFLDLEVIRWLRQLHWTFTIPILMGEPCHTGVSLFWYTGHGSNLSNSCLRITGVVARWCPSFQWSWRSSPQARRISNVSDYFIQFSKNGKERKWGGRHSLLHLFHFDFKSQNCFNQRSSYSAFQFHIDHDIHISVFVIERAQAGFWYVSVIVV